MSLQCLPSSFDSIRSTVWDEMLFEEFQDGHHGGQLGYWNGSILAILNLCNANHQISAQSDLWFGRRCHLMNFKMAPWRLSWLTEWNDFSNSESLCPCDASHQVLAQSNKVWEEKSFGEFQDGHHGSHLGYQNQMILAILNLYNTPMPHIKFRLNLTYGLGGDVVWRISRWPLWRPSWISEQNDFSNSESLSLWCLPSSFRSIGLTVWEEILFEEF